MPAAHTEDLRTPPLFLDSRPSLPFFIARLQVCIYYYKFHTAVFTIFINTDDMHAVCCLFIAHALFILLVERMESDLQRKKSELSRLVV